MNGPFKGLTTIIVSGFEDSNVSKAFYESQFAALLVQALAKAGKERAERQLKMIEAALMRIDNDEYGECMECGEPINPKRLEIDPTTLYCIDCAR